MYGRDAEKKEVDTGRTMKMNYSPVILRFNRCSVSASSAVDPVFPWSEERLVWRTSIVESSGRLLVTMRGPPINRYVRSRPHEYDCEEICGNKHFRTFHATPLIVNSLWLEGTGGCRGNSFIDRQIRRWFARRARPWNDTTVQRKVSDSGHDGIGRKQKQNEKHFISVTTWWCLNIGRWRRGEHQRAAGLRSCGKTDTCDLDRKSQKSLSKTTENSERYSKTEMKDVRQQPTSNQARSIRLYDL